MQASIRELKNQFSHYIGQVKYGHEVIVTYHNKPVAKIIPFSSDMTDPISMEDFIAELRVLHKKMGDQKLQTSMRDTVIELRDEERY